MFGLPTPTHVCGVGFDPSYFITSFGDEQKDVVVTYVVFKGGKAVDSYLAVGAPGYLKRNYITLPLEGV